jgi:aminoglycoside phosphotransferase (APT) family kinase protein
VDVAPPSREVIRALLHEQFPHWASEPLDPHPLGAGSDHVLNRLGDDLVLRFPLRRSAADRLQFERMWLRHVASVLPVRVPTPLAHGGPGYGYPFPWSVGRFLPGEDATTATITDHHAFARDLAAAVQALRTLPTRDDVVPEALRSPRGVPTAARDDEVRAALADLRADPLPGIDLDAATRVWEDALAAPVHEGPPVWLHGDLLPGNLLVLDGRLLAVIDFGLLGVGDPAADLLPAWAALPASARATYRDALAPDEAAWRRGRGAAVAFGLVALPYHRTRTPGLARVAHRTITEVVAEIG